MNVMSGIWLPSVLFILFGFLMIVMGLFMTQINQLFGSKERSELFTVPHFKRSARQTMLISRGISVLLGLGMCTQGIGNLIGGREFLNIISWLLLGLAGICILAVIVITARNWRA